MEVKEVLALVAEMKEEEKKTTQVPHYYKRNGQLVKRQYPDRVYTPRYRELFFGDTIRKHKIFKCEDCGEMVNYFDLESWCCNFETGEYICSECYETELGDDL